MPYADYTFYTHEYGGKEISEEDFPALSNRASAYIDAVTSGSAKRTSGDTLISVKMAACNLAEIFQDEYRFVSSATTTEGKLVSEAVGNWSRTYRSESTSAADISWIEDRKRESLMIWLGNTGLLKVRAMPRCRPCFRMW